MLQASLQKNDKKANWLIWIFSAIVFLAVVLLEKITLKVDLGFDPHIFAKMSAIINFCVAILLVMGLWYIKQKNYVHHKNAMLAAMLLSIFFLVFYIAHHLFTGETKYGDIDHDGVVSVAEAMMVGNIRYVYYFIIGSHVLLAGIVMPFVLYSAYHALTSEFSKHKKLVRYTFPIWLYVAVTGVVVYLMISKYY